MTTKTQAISNGDDIIDSRDVIARIEELETEREYLADAYKETETDLQNDNLTDEVLLAALQEAMEASQEALAAWDEDNGDELKALRELQEQAEGYAPDWKYGATLIRESYFQTYAQDLAEDIGAIQKDATWPNNYIDWEAATEALQQDYTSVDFDGVTYWVR